MRYPYSQVDLTKNFRDRNGERRARDASDWLFALALFVAILLAYHPVLQAGFIWDDDKYVTRNPLLAAPDPWRRIWFSLDAPSQYFPLTYTTFYLERAFWGLNPAGYHLMNLLLHAANALLVWRILARLRVPGRGWRRRCSPSIRCRWKRLPGFPSARTS